MKKVLVLLLLFSIVFTNDVQGATGCNFPTSLDSFSDKGTGDQVSVADWNTRSCGIEKIEAELGVNPSGTYSTVVLRLNAAFDLNGISGGQIAHGDTASGGVLKLGSTFHATKGKIWFGTASTLGSSSAYDEANVRLGIGTQTPATDIQVAKNATTIVQINAAGTSVSPSFLGAHARSTLASPTATQQGDVLVRLGGIGRGATGNSGTVAAFDLSANQNFTDSAQGTYASIYLVPDGSTTAAERFRLHYNGLRLGTSGFPDTSLHLTLNASSHAAITLDESTATPTDPTSQNQIRMYMKDDKIIFQYNQAGTVRYKYMGMNLADGTSWVHTTTPP